MAWIKMNVTLASHPKVVRISSGLRADRMRTIGGLYSVWSIFDTHSADGRLDGYTTTIMDDLIGWPGFTEAMVAVGWIEVGEGNFLTVKDFTEHNGSSAKARAQDTRAKQDRRAMDKETKLSGTEPDKGRTREEKSREETDISNDSGNESPATAHQELLNRAKSLFRIRPQTPLDSSTASAWKKNKGAVAATTEDQWEALEWWYKQGTGKGSPGEYRRRELSTLLNNWSGGISQALELMGQRPNSEKKEKRVAAPEGWFAALRDLYPDSAEANVDAAEDGFHALALSIRKEIVAHLAH